MNQSVKLFLFWLWLLPTKFVRRIKGLQFEIAISPKSFDGRGNYALGLKEHLVFPEIDFDKVTEIWGMDVVICTTAVNDQEAMELLKNFNMPFPIEAS